TNEYVTVPGDWSSSLTNEETNAAYGYGTYHLQLVLPPSSNQMYGLRIPDVHTSSMIYINGELAGSSGYPDVTAENYTPERKPYQLTFTAETQTVDIVIHIAN